MSGQDLDREVAEMRLGLQAGFEARASEVARISNGDLAVEDADPILIRSLAMYVAMQTSERVAAALKSIGEEATSMRPTEMPARLHSERMLVPQNGMDMKSSIVLILGHEAGDPAMLEAGWLWDSDYGTDGGQRSKIARALSDEVFRRVFGEKPVDLVDRLIAEPNQ